MLAACGTSLSSPSASTVTAGPVGVATGRSPSSAASAAIPPGWKLTWQDNFHGTGFPSGWISDDGGNGFGDRQLEWNTAANARSSPGGGLVLTATKGGAGRECWYGPCTYTGAKIETTFSQAYGLFEARIKLPAGHGLWPAFWMIPAASSQSAAGEIDVVEVNGTQPYLVSGYVHNQNVRNYRAASVLDTPTASQYHTYGVEWTPRGITWLLDGQSYGHINAYPGWPFDQPFKMLLTLAVGGTWPGAPSAATVFPAHMLVSWIRVYQAP